MATCTPPPDGDNTGDDPPGKHGCVPEPSPEAGSSEPLIFNNGASVAPNVAAVAPPPSPLPPPSPAEASVGESQAPQGFIMKSTGANTPPRPTPIANTSPSPQSRSTGANTPPLPSTTAIRTSTTVSNSLNNNTPPFPGSNVTFIDNSPIFQTPNPIFDIYDRAYNYDIETKESVLKLASIKSNIIRREDPNNVFNSITDRTLDTVLKTQGGISPYIPFNSTTLGSYLYNTQLIKESLSPATKKALSTVANYNTTSLHLYTYFIKGLLNAVVNGTIKDYSISFFNNISNQSRREFPNGVPTLSDPYTQREQAFNLIEKNKITLNTSKYPVGTVQKKVQMLYLNPKDIDLTAPVTTAVGILNGLRVDCGVRVDYDGTVGVVTTGGTVEKVQTQNEFLNVPVKRSGTFFPRKIPLRSNRDKAYQLSVPTLSMVQGLLDVASPVGVSPSLDYGVTLSFSGINNSMTDNLEVVNHRQELPEAMLFSLMKETITDLPSSRSEFRKTQATYKMSWQSGDDTSAFDQVVQYHSGPRDSYYIDGDDPIASYIMEADVSSSNKYATLTFNDLNIELPNTVLPRRILTDFIIYFTNRIKYSPFQAQSSLDKYEADIPFKRSVRMVTNPLTSIQRDPYVVTTSPSDGRSVSGRLDSWAINFTKSFVDGRKLPSLSRSGDNLLTQQSALGKSIVTLSSIDTNYDLSDGRKGKRLPSNDLYSFFTFKDFVNFIKIPETVRLSLLSGSFFSSPITVYPLKKTDTEKTYLTTTRLKTGMSDSLLSDQIQKVVPKIGYFPGRVGNAKFEGGR